MADAYKQATGSTMSTGAPAPSDRDSLTVGPDGPILLHDVHFLEQMAHFNREKVPERQPHAKGAGAFGVFKATEDVTAFTRAALFQKGATTDMTDRLKAELPEMFREHQAVVAALKQLTAAAEEEKLSEHARFAEKLTLHAQTEEEVLYPAAILVGEYVKLKLGV